MNLILKERKDREETTESSNCAGGTECFGDVKEKRMIDNNNKKEI